MGEKRDDTGGEMEKKEIKGERIKRVIFKEGLKFFEQGEGD
jgi:hypothetical protein